MTAFGGNPNVVITAISTAGGIVCSRTSGTTPCFLQVSASAITATGTTAPYEDLEYSWDFGDPTGTETFTQPLSANLLNAKGNITVNANSDQTGPEAAYVYRSAGTYTITLTIRGQNGGVFTTNTVTQSIVVSAFNPTAGEFYLDSVHGNDANNGTSAATPKQSKSNLITWLANTQTGPVRINLAQGSNWTDAAGIQNAGANAGLASNFPVRIRDYVGTGGAGPKPIIGCTNSATPAANNLQIFTGTGWTVGDIVISNIELFGSGTQVNSLFDCQAFASAVSHVYLDNVDLTSTFTTQGGVNLSYNSSYTTGANNTILSKCGVWGGTSSMQTAVTVSATRHNMQFGAMNWQFVVGQTVTGAGSDPSLDHHFYTENVSHWLFRYINFGSGPGRNYAINGNIFDSVATAGTAPYFCISDCTIGGTTNGIDLDNTINDPSRSTFDSVVVQRCAFTNLSTTGYCALFSAANGVTFRDNLVYPPFYSFFAPDTQVTGATTAQQTGTYLVGKVYRNSIYSTSGTSWPIIDYSHGGNFTNKQFITDNKIYSTGTVAQLFDLISANQVTAVSIIDRNQYYAPSDADGSYLYNSGTAQTFTAWRALGFDANGSAGVDPGWIDPANGNFQTSVSTRGGRGGKGLKF